MFKFVRHKTNFKYTNKYHCNKSKQYSSLLLVVLFFTCISNPLWHRTHYPCRHIFPFSFDVCAYPVQWGSLSWYMAIKYSKKSGNLAECRAGSCTTITYKKPPNEHNHVKRVTVKCYTLTLVSLISFAYNENMQSITHLVRGIGWVNAHCWINTKHYFTVVNILSAGNCCNYCHLIAKLKR